MRYLNLMSSEASWIERVENVHNKLSDRNAIWFPFQFLKPTPDRVIPFSRTVAMSLCFGLWGAILYFLRKKLLWPDPSFADTTWFWIWENFHWFVAGFLVWFNLVTAYFWNRRARRIKKQ